jgi:hypothetical protein
LILSPSIRTAAGARTFPVRGSRNLPALTRMMGTADWASGWTVEATATSATAETSASFRMQLNRSPAISPKSCVMEDCIPDSHPNYYMLQLPYYVVRFASTGTPCAASNARWLALHKETASGMCDYAARDHDSK